LAREGLGEARRSVWALRPQVLEGGDLPDALRRLVGQLTAGTQAETEFSLQGTPRPLPQEVEVNLLRIAQESLANALKHSKASKVDVELSYGPHDVVLSVQDNGRGFDPRQRSIDSGFGLISLHERAERVGAQLTVYSEPGLGTRIVVVVPGALPHAQGGSM
jgi:signal transduction histidine kinase